jgi:hypothetical protein
LGKAFDYCFSAVRIIAEMVLPYFYKPILFYFYQVFFFGPISKAFLLFHPIERLGAVAGIRAFHFFFAIPNYKLLSSYLSLLT